MSVLAAPADGGATGTVLIPSMIRNRLYLPGFAAARSARARQRSDRWCHLAWCLSSSAARHPVSIGQLFLGGILPGLLMGIYLMVAVWIVARRRGYGAGVQRATLREIGRTFLPPTAGDADADLGDRHGIVGGIVTATEAGAVAVLYPILTIVYGEMRWRRVFPMLNEVMLMTAVIYHPCSACSTC